MKYGKYIRTLTDAEKKGYYNAYMKPENLSESWLSEHITYKLYKDRSYTIIRAFKRTDSGQLLPIYQAEHKCMERFRIV